MAHIKNLKAGQTVYSRGRTKMGNTSMSRDAEWSVYIEEVDETNNRVLASWNGNASKWCPEYQYKRWFLTKKKSKKKSGHE